MTYYFRIGPLVFIINIQFSGIGFSYPRIFVRFPDGSCINCDLSLPAVFGMTEEDWDSWLDGTEILLNSKEEIETVCKENGINWDIFEQAIFEEYEKSL